MIKIEFNDHQGWQTTEYIIGSLSDALAYAKHIQSFISCSAKISNA